MTEMTNESYSIDVFQNSVRVETVLLVLDDKNISVISFQPEPISFPQKIQLSNIEQVQITRDYVQLKLKEGNYIYYFQSVFAQQILHYLFLRGVKILQLIHQNEPGFIDYSEYSDKILHQTVKYNNKEETLHIQKNCLKVAEITIQFADIQQCQRDDFNFVIEITTAHGQFDFELCFKIKQVLFSVCDLINLRKLYFTSVQSQVGSGKSLKLTGFLSQSQKIQVPSFQKSIDLSKTATRQIGVDRDLQKTILDPAHFRNSMRLGQYLSAYQQSTEQVPTSASLSTTFNLIKTRALPETTQVFKQVEAVKNTVHEVEVPTNAYLLTEPEFLLLKERFSNGFVRFVNKNQVLSAENQKMFEYDLQILKNFVVYTKKCAKSDSEAYISQFVHSGRFLEPSMQIQNMNANANNFNATMNTTLNTSLKPQIQNNNPPEQQTFLFDPILYDQLALDYCKQFYQILQEVKNISEIKNEVETFKAIVKKTGHKRFQAVKNDFFSVEELSKLIAKVLGQ
ncbi:Hypothetical_protein [Hexamita inflata]|uniref:Hypothetical_protein n=1 Tax=Hexamita inflata TaxID=28002 RepID=A0AA86PUE1_9EUKA|nr:Hypothetical protein HINF_LOCUS32651 [Hexamita inflata]